MIRLPALVGGAEGGGTHTELVEPATERQATVNEGNCNTEAAHGIGTVLGNLEQRRVYG
jgi:hypothetical protein